MKFFFITIVFLNVYQTVFSQITPRSTINFNYNWEMFRIDSSTRMKKKMYPEYKK